MNLLLINSNIEFSSEFDLSQGTIESIIQFEDYRNELAENVDLKYVKPKNPPKTLGEKRDYYNKLIKYLYSEAEINSINDLSKIVISKDEDYLYKIQIILMNGYKLDRLFDHYISTKSSARFDYKEDSISKMVIYSNRVLSYIYDYNYRVGITINYLLDLSMDLSKNCPCGKLTSVELPGSLFKLEKLRPINSTINKIAKIIVDYRYTTNKSYDEWVPEWSSGNSKEMKDKIKHETGLLTCYDCAVKIYNVEQITGLLTKKKRKRLIGDAVNRKWIK